MLIFLYRRMSFFYVLSFHLLTDTNETILHSIVKIIFVLANEKSQHFC